MNVESRSKCDHSLLLVLIAGLFLTFPGGLFAQHVCQSEAHAWVASHASDLPKTYEELSLFPLTYRRAIYAALPSANKSQLWRVQIERYLRRGDELTPQQKDVLLDALRLATPETFAATKEQSTRRYRRVRQQLSSLEAQARAAFGTERAERIFARIGPADTDTLFFIDKRAAEAVEPLLEGIDEALAAANPGCSCSDASDYCSGGFNCTPGSCIRIADECGTFWTYDCDGLCQVNATILSQ
jgi:hypothetical protein